MAKRNHKNRASKITGSTGPITAEGKIASSQNAIKHGLASSKLFVLPNENPQIFAEFHALIFDTYKPVDQLEIDLVAEMAGARWRLRRLWSIETGLFNLAINSQLEVLNKSNPNLDESLRQTLGFEQMAKDKSLSLLIRYEARIRRSFERACADLLRLQKHRGEKETQPQPETPTNPEPTTPQPQQTKPPNPENEKAPNEPPPLPSNPGYNEETRERSSDG